MGADGVCGETATYDNPPPSTLGFGEPAFAFALSASVATEECVVAGGLGLRLRLLVVTAGTAEGDDEPGAPVDTVAVVEVELIDGLSPIAPLTTPAAALEAEGTPRACCVAGGSMPKLVITSMRARISACCCWTARWAAGPDAASGGKGDDIKGCVRVAAEGGAGERDRDRATASMPRERSSSSVGGG